MRRLLVLLTILVVAFAGSVTVPWSADATVPGGVGRILFASGWEGNSELYTRDFAGGTWTRLTSTTDNEGEPAWSPDGSKIAYRRGVSGLPDIWVMDADGSNQLNLTKASTSFEIRPAWSPDGSRIVYESDLTGSFDIWVMGADGSSRTNLTPSTTSSQEADPAWSPDGSTIAFASDRDGPRTEIYLMDADGTNQRNLTKSPTTWDSDPAWSPDGSQIAYVSVAAGGKADIWVMDPDGTNKANLTPLTPGSDETTPAWSPDGQHILFSSQADGDWDLWMVNPDGTDAGHLTDHPGDEHDGAWESVNRLPVAVDDGPYSVQYGGVLNGPSVLANDSDPDGEQLVANAISAPSHALGFALNPDGTFLYQHHNASFETSDSFTYRAQDTRSGVSNMATVTITILPGTSPTFGLDTVGLVDPSSGVWRLHDSVDVVSSFYYGNPGDYPFVGDWDCDGRVTPGLYRQSDGFAYLRNSNTQGVADVSFFFGDPGDVPIAGDFNADGCDTLSIYRPTNQRFYVINELGADGGGLGAADYDFLFGNPGDTPVVGDWDGDATDEIGLYRESSGFFYYRDTLTTGVADGQFYFGNPGDRFVAGDWGIVDGRETPGLFRPSNQTFYFRYTLTQGNADAELTWTGAGASWLPVSGNFNLD